MTENEYVALNVTKSTSTPDAAAVELGYVETLRKKLETSEPAPGLEEVRRRLSKISGEMTADFIAEREVR